MASLKYKPRIIKIRCPGDSIESRNGIVKSFDLDDEQEAGWPEIEPIILGWLELADSEDLCLTPKFLSYVAQIPVGFATERLEALYEKDMAFKSVDDGTEMFCFEDPDDFDDDPDNDPDGGEPMPINLDGANNEEFYPLDTRKVANNMLKELIKMAGEFDRLGLSKEADKIDAMIRKVAGGRHELSSGRNRLLGDHKFLTRHDPRDLMYHPELDEVGHTGEYNEDEEQELFEGNPTDIEDREVASPEDSFMSAEEKHREDFPEIDSEEWKKNLIPEDYPTMSQRHWADIKSRYENRTKNSRRK